MKLDNIAAAEGLLDWLIDRAEKLEDEGFPNGAAGSRAWGEAVDALLAERTALREALTFYATSEWHEVDSDRGSIASKALKGEL